MAIEQRYTAFETAKNYTKHYELDGIDSILTRQEDGMMGYVSAGQFATTGSNIFDGGQVILGNLNIDGNIIANNFVTSSTLLFTGSTNHGSLIGDVHTYTGSVRISGSLSVIGGINGVINATNGVVSSSAQITSFGFISSSQTINTGSLATTGSNTFIGNQTVTGSFLVSGSTTQIGNNTLSGNTIMSGTLDVSGSTTFRGVHQLSGSNSILGNTIMSGSVSVSGSTFIEGNTTIKGMLFVSGSTNFSNHTITMTGSMFTSGSQIITGSLDIAGNLNIASGSAFYRWGNKLFNYGTFYSTITQSGSANVSQSMSYNNTDYASGVSIVNGSQITLQNVGIYNIQFSAQLVDTSFGDSTIRIWLKKNGTNVPNTATKIFLPSNEELVAAWNWIVPATSPNDYYVITWQTTDNDAHILYEPASGNYPAIPSVILTVTQVA
jgi:hypothetical protein